MGRLFGFSTGGGYDDDGTAGCEDGSDGAIAIDFLPILFTLPGWRILSPALSCINLWVTNPWGARNIL